jgi:hypothetical protein
LHAYIKYEDGQFVVIDNNSKFGTLILLRKNYKIERKKIALQIGRTVVTFSLKQTSVNNVPIFKNPMLMEKCGKSQQPQLPSKSNNPQPKSSSVLNNINKHKNIVSPIQPESENNNNPNGNNNNNNNKDNGSNKNNDNYNLNGSFID